MEQDDTEYGANDNLHRSLMSAVRRFGVSQAPGGK